MDEDDDDDEEKEKEQKEDEKEEKEKEEEEEDADERKFLYFFMPGGRLKSTLASPPSHNGTTQHYEHSRPFLWLRY